MAERDLDNLKTLRAYYVELRRKSAAHAAADSRESLAGTAMEKVEKFQDRIEMLDRAIADEERLERTAAALESGSFVGRQSRGGGDIA